MERIVRTSGASMPQGRRCERPVSGSELDPPPGMGEQLVARAIADWANEHAETSPSEIQRWALSPATDKQRELLKLAFLDQASLYEAMCLVLEHAKHRETA